MPFALSKNYYCKPLCNIHKAIEQNNLTGRSISTAGGKGTIYPHARLVNEDGSAAIIPKDHRLAYIDTAGSALPLDWKYRPLDELRLADNNAALQDINLNILAAYTIFPWLSADLRYQYGRQSTQVSNYFSTDTYFTRNLINRFSQLNGNTVKYIVPVGGIIDKTDVAIISNGKSSAEYKQELGQPLQAGSNCGAEIRQLTSSYYGSRQYGYNKDFLTYANMDYITQKSCVWRWFTAAQNIVAAIAFSDITNRFTSLFANTAFTWANKYTFSASARKDASNIFGVSTNQKAVPLWSAGLAWNITKEKFYNTKWLPQLRLRATYGFSGNADNSRSAWATIEYSTAPDVYTNLPFATVINPPNPTLRWEKVGMFNLGFDFATVDNRIAGSIEYYRKKAVDLLAAATSDPTMLYTLVLNSASIKGQGIDIQLSTVNTKGKSWSTVYIFAFTSNKLVKYLRDIGTARSYAGAGNTFNPAVGKEAYGLYSYRWAGLDPATGEPQGYLDGQISKNYSAIRNALFSSLVYHGSAAPLYSGAFRNTITWKNFSLSANIQYKLGYWFRRLSVNYNALAASWTTHSDFSCVGRNPVMNTTNVPAFTYPVSSVRDEFYSYSEAPVEKADHIRFKDIRLESNWNNGKQKISCSKTHRFIASPIT